ncbi:hypothetical protein LMG7974_01908 [Campylobacter majalis]|uniref:Beta-ketoacyl-[acyl-carrier-protein] synthase III N-terminal domain-containing protein n=1 Tax=Campylobacter majalis TaxID=2790656 RepID=A0ABM8QA07_9BACT|nr:3-oxoacyl-ACP synthase [Campylobacter majalis]CAD7289825.1 hypothetical protein LMG7974_01908 [Campylobacter majalis]
MNKTFKAHKISAISVAMGQNYISFESEMIGTSTSKIELAKQNFGINAHYLCDDNTYASDLGTAALKSLLDSNAIEKEHIDMLMCVTHTPDFLAPQTSSLIHKNLNLSQDTFCVDMTAYCFGFLQALQQAFINIQSGLENIVIICISAKSHLLDKTDKISYAAYSDSASCILVQRASNLRNFAFASKTFSQYAKEETKPLCAYNKKGIKTLIINNAMFFKFIMENFPPFFDEFLEKNTLNKDEIDTFYLHSPNAFFKTKLCQCLNISLSKCLAASLSLYANADTNNIPLNLILHKWGGGSGIKRAIVASYGTGITMNIASFDINLDEIKFAKISCYSDF